jgi:hypothetical protein
MSNGYSSKLSIFKQLEMLLWANPIRFFYFSRKNYRIISKKAERVGLYIAIFFSASRKKGGSLKKVFPLQSLLRYFISKAKFLKY